MLASRFITVFAGQSVSVRVKSTYDRLPQEQEIENRLIRGESALETIEILPEDGIFSLNGMNAVLISPAMLLASGTNYLPEQVGNYTPPRINLAAVAGILREKARAVFQANTADFANFNENNVPLAVTGMDLVFSKPQAYLKLQVFDATGTILLSEKKQLISENALNAWETLSLGASIPQDAKIKVSLINETEQEAYFDELEIVISNKPTTKIVQENNYYPFGLNMRGLEKVGSPDDKFQYNAQTEKDEDIEMYETPFRGYDPAIGRFDQVDLLAPLFPSITPFHFGYNNPVYFNDPSGLAAQAQDPGKPCNDCQNHDPMKDKEKKKSNNSSSGSSSNFMSQEAGVRGNKEGGYYAPSGNKIANSKDGHTYYVPNFEGSGGGLILQSEKFITNYYHVVDIGSYDVRQKMLHAVEDSNNPSTEANDPFGGYHEEGGLWGYDKDTNEQKAFRAKPLKTDVRMEDGFVTEPLSPYAGSVDPFNVSIPNNYTIIGVFHVHNKGITRGKFMGEWVVTSPEPFPSDKDYSVAVKRGGIHFVLSAAYKNVYIYTKKSVETNTGNARILTTIPFDIFFNIGKPK